MTGANRLDQLKDAGRLPAGFDSWSDEEKEAFEKELQELTDDEFQKILDPDPEPTRAPPIHD